MTITVLAWNEKQEAEANDVKYVIRKDESTGWWWAWLKLPDRIETIRLTRPGNYHGTKQEAKSLAQADAEKRSESDRTREPGIRRIRG